MLLIDSFKILLLILFIFEEGIGILFPYFSLLFINLLLVNFFSMFIFDLSCQVLPHLFLLLFSCSSSPLFLFFFFSQLVFNMLHHFFVLGSNLLFLVLDDWICEWGHDCFYFFFSFFFLFFSFSLELILKPCIFFLCFDILNNVIFTYNLSRSAYYLSLLWF